MAFILPRDCDSSVREIHDYWCEIRPAGRLPARDHMDPVDLPTLLPRLWMADVEREPLRFRFRLIGSSIVQALGEDLTGRYLDECFDNFIGSPPHKTLYEICEHKEPAWRRGAALLTRKHYNIKQMERIFLPFATDGETVDMFLALSVYVADETVRSNRG